MLNLVRKSLHYRNHEILFKGVQSEDTAQAPVIKKIGNIEVMESNTNFIISKTYKLQDKDVYVIRENDIEFLGLKKPYDSSTSVIKNIIKNIEPGEILNAIGRCEIHQVYSINSQDGFIDFIDKCDFILQIGKGDEAKIVLAIEDNLQTKTFLVDGEQLKEVDISILNIY